jgi:hypothetical protein
MNNTNSRRDFLRKISAIVGTTAATTLLAGNSMSVALAYSPSVSGKLNAGKIFSLDQMQNLLHICDIVIPKTETPSAGDIDTHGFIDNQLFHCFTKEKQDEIVAVLNLIDQKAQTRHQQAFSALSHDNQFSLLTDLDVGQKEFSSEQRSQFKSLKALICFGYYTSEVGASQELNYQAFPGGYKGSIPYKSSDKAWGSLGFRY